MKRRTEEQKAMNNWYVLTGGPSSGKTTLINELRARGYATVPEMARHFIDERLAGGESVKEIEGSEADFQEAVLRHQLAAEKRLSREQLTFFDRGIPDTLAYYRYHNLKETESIKQAVAECSYRKVFMLDLLPIVSDYARQETERQQHVIGDLIRKAYAELSFPMVSVPVLPVNERVDFILAHLNGT